MAEWQAEQFPGSSAPAAAKHLLKEARELSIVPFDLEEWADAMFLVIQGMRMVNGGGINAVHTHGFQMVKDKLLYNIVERQWQEPDADGVVEHVKPENMVE